MTSPRSRPPYLTPLLGLAAFLAVAISLAVFWEPPSRTRPARPRSPATVAGAEDLQEPVRLATPSALATAQLWLEVERPAKLKAVLRENAWLQEALRSPLGEGFVGGWSAFLGSRGEDLRAQFKGAVAEVVADQLLADPFRVVWFVEGTRSGIPTVVVPQTSTAAAAAFALLDQAARKGTLVLEACPAKAAGDDPSVALPEDGVRIARWLIAETAVYAGLHQDRMVLARSPKAVAHGLCAPLPPKRGEGDLSLVLDPRAFGRDAQAFAHALGLKGPLALTLDADRNTLRPGGLSAALSRSPLVQGTLPSSMLRSLPEETPVVLALSVSLPKTLDTASLTQFLKGKGAAKPLGRQVALAWTPRGDRNLPTEIAVLWSRAEDTPALRQLFSGPNPLATREVCGHAAFASTDELLARMARACAGAHPSLQNAAPEVKAGWRAPSALALGLHVGRLLSQLTLDGYWSDTPVDAKRPLPRTAPEEVEAARRTLEALPYFGFTGKAEGEELVGGGFRS